MQTVPLVAQPSQTLVVSLGNFSYTINVYQKSFYSDNNESGVQMLTTPVFIDIYLNGVAVLTGALCLDGVKIIRNVYFGFPGDLVFVDMQGTSDPYYTGFGTRYLLVYLSLADLAGLKSIDT